MRTSIIAAALVLLTTIGAVFTPVLHATPTTGFLSTRGTSIVDSAGQAIVLRGVNYPGYEQDHPELHSQIAYGTFAGNGFNVVRLPLSWANLEPQPGALDSAYLSYADQDVQWAKSAGIYVILDMHQTNWAGRFGGEGAPDWMVRNYAANESGMQQAVSDFWSNTTQQDLLVQVWVKIAQHFANEPTIAGYDLFNEPWIFTSVISDLNATHALEAFYIRTIQAIRAVDTNHIIFLEPGNVQMFKLPMANIVWTPHFYPLSFASKFNLDNYTFLENDFMAKYQTFVIDYGTPMWIGEFGAFMPDNASRAIWIEVALDFFNRYNIGWGWWAYDGQYTSIPDQLYVPS